MPGSRTTRPNPAQIRRSESLAKLKIDDSKPSSAALTRFVSLRREHRSTCPSGGAVHHRTRNAGSRTTVPFDSEVEAGWPRRESRGYHPDQDVKQNHTFAH